MIPRFVVVTGTGTDIGKTHFAEAFLLAAGRAGLQACGLKPVETGVHAGVATDAARLARSSTFHVKHMGVRFSEPVSPHLAARDSAVRLDVQATVEELTRVAEGADVALVELAGGLFSPFNEEAVNADLVLALAPSLHLLVVPDRLGALHDAIAATRAAAAMGVSLHGIVVMAPALADASTGRNGAELPRFCGVPVVAELPRAPVDVLAGDPQISALVSGLA